MTECGGDSVSSAEEDLALFEGMEGFEGINISDDSSLLALLGLQEEALINIFGDDSFAKDLADFSVGSTSNSDDQLCRTSPFANGSEDVYLQPNVMVNPSDFLVNPSDFLEIKDAMHEGSKHSIRFEVDSIADCATKKARLDLSATGSAQSPFGWQHSLTCALHDHCYTTTGGQLQLQPTRSITNSDEEASTEEGSNSDTGTPYTEFTFWE